MIIYDCQKTDFLKVFRITILTYFLDHPGVDTSRHKILTD